MVAFFSWIVGKLIDSQSRKRRWLRRMLMFVAVVRWIDRRGRRTRVVRIGRHEHAEITVVGENGGVR